MTHIEMLKTGFITLPELVSQSVTVLESDAMKAAEYADLGGYDANPYGDLAKQIDRTIGMLKRTRAEVQALRSHAHKWNSDDYCSVCGADGRA
jgi:hypothetical protein